MRYRLVIFDFDGTLANSLAWFRVAINEAAALHGFRRTSAGELEALRSKGPGEIMRHLDIPVWKVPRVVRTMRAAMSRDIERIPLFDGVGELLRRLRAAGIALAVVTSNSRDNVSRILGPQNALLFDFYACGVPVMGKRARFRKLVRESGFAPREVLCVGDELRDLDAAQQEGLAFGGVSWGYSAPEALAGRSPSVMFHRLDEIFEHVATG